MTPRLKKIIPTVSIILIAVVVAVAPAMGVASTTAVTQQPDNTSPSTAFSTDEATTNGTSADSATVQRISFDYYQGGGNLNLEVNGERESNISSFEQAPPEGVDKTLGGTSINVTQGSADFGERGTVEITGEISSFSVGGQEMPIDNVEFGSADAPNANVTFNDLTPNATYALNDTVISNGIEMQITPFISAEGENCSTNSRCGSASLTDGSSFVANPATTPSFYPNNVNVEFDLTSVPTGSDEGSNGGTDNGTADSEIQVVPDPQAASVTTNGTSTLDLVLTNADGGVGTYGELAVSLNDTSAAKIAGISEETGAGEDTVDVASDGSEASISASFGGDTIDSGDAVLASVNITGASPGQTELNITVNGDIFREDGTIYDVNGTRGATITTTGAPTVVEDTPATDTDGDGKADDLNGNGVPDRGDAQALFDAREDPEVSNNAELFDYNGNGVVDRGDVQALFQLAKN